MTRVTCNFGAAQKVYSYPYICAKGKNNPKRKINQRQFFRRVISGIHWKIFVAVFLRFIAGKCHGSVNIYNLGPVIIKKKYILLYQVGVTLTFVRGNISATNYYWMIRYLNH